MVAQNVQAGGISAMSAVYSEKARKQAAEGANFEDLLKNTKSITAGKPEEAKDAKDVKLPEASDAKPETELKNEASGSKAELKTEKEASTAETAKTTDTLQTEEEIQKEAAEISDTELLERVAAFVLQVAELVQELLGLTKEQFDSMLGQLGMTEADLLSTDMLTDFYLNVKQAPDASVLLTDDSLLQGLKELGAAIEEMAEQHGFPKELLEQQMEMPEFAEVLRSFKEGNYEAPDAEDVQDTEDAGVPAAETEAVAAKETRVQGRTKEVTLEFKEEGAMEKAPVRHSEAAEDKAPETMVQGGQFLQNLEEAVTQKAEAVSGQTDIVALVREIADQLLERVRVVVSPETTSLEIQLTPEHLGKVGLTLSEQDGVLKAKFFTENELAKQAIETNLIQFKETLNEQGLRVESIEVMVSEFSFDKNGQAEQSGQGGEQKGRRHFAADEAEESMAKPDRLAEHFLSEGESTVNYMA